MNFRLVFSGAFCIVLAVSLALKLPGNTDIAVAKESAVPREIAALLEHQGFQVSQDNPDNDLTWVAGNADACYVLVAPVAPQGWHQALVAQVAAGNLLFYFFEGQTYAEQPTMRTRGHYYWRKLNRYLGLSAPDRPVLAAVATPTCENLPLRELAMLTEK
ncbi:hypothetical protein [Microvirga alba]|uniref:Uncharacterized protein n=1 Tax=Microvirga alba TaxID=2791025 RepID=A0A931BW54_9HYPH|nr:hypothetical protein [Microvirga alba]MBF9233912.1 hypothetical protein [Microvirga alba]